MKKARWIWIGLGVSLAVGTLLSLAASPHPDGLERVAEDRGFLGQAVEIPLLASPLAGYLFPGIADERLAAGLAGFLGTLVLFAVGCAVGWLLRRAAHARGA